MSEQKPYKIPIELRRCQWRWSPAQFFVRATSTFWLWPWTKSADEKANTSHQKQRLRHGLEQKTARTRGKIDFANIAEKPRQTGYRLRSWATVRSERRRRAQMLLLFRWCLHINLLVRQLKIFVDKLVVHGTGSRRETEGRMKMDADDTSERENESSETPQKCRNSRASWVAQQPHRGKISIFGRIVGWKSNYGFNRRTTHRYDH